MKKLASGLVLLQSITILACSKVIRQAKVDDGVVISETAPVRNSTAQLALEVASMKKGEEVEILERKGSDWTRIRTQTNIVGWTESRHLVSRSMIERVNEMTEQTSWIPAQATGRLVSHAALRVSPGRSSDRNVALYLPTGLNVEILTRERTLRMSDEIIPRQFTAQIGRGAAARRGSDPPVQYDFWYQVRLPETYLLRVGWIYSPFVELRIPPHLVNLQGDKVIVGWFEIDELDDEEAGLSHHYLTFERDRYRPVAGTDFDQVKLFIWDLHGHQYRSTWQRVYGLLPVRRSLRGELPAFEMQTYNEKTGALEHAVFTVDVRDVRRAQLLRVKEKVGTTRR